MISRLADPGHWARVNGHRSILGLMLAQIHQPVLVMAGDRDLIRLDHTLAIYQALPNAQLFILPDTGHGTFDTRPALVNPVLLGFLARS